MHIPKTAGSSIKIFLDNQYLPAQIQPAQAWGALARDFQYDEYLLTRGHFSFNMSQALPGVKILAVLREPLRRCVSALRHIQRDARFHPLHEVAKDLPLGEILRSPQIMRAQRDVQAGYLCASVPPSQVRAYMAHHPQGDPGMQEPAAGLDRAVERLQAIAFLGVMEALDDCVEDMSKAMNFHRAVYFPFVNEDPAFSNTLENLSSEDLDILREANQLDLRVYEAAKMLIAQRRFAAMMRGLLAAGVYKIQPGSFDIDVGGVMPGSGWYPAEREGGGCWRWTGPGCQASLELPLCAQAAYDVMIGFNVADPQVVGGLAVAVNDAAVRHSLVSSGSRAFSLAFRIPQESLGACDGLCRIVLSVPTVRPTGELRALGIAVNKILFERVG